MTNKLPPKVEDFLRELFGDELEIIVSSLRDDSLALIDRQKLLTYVDKKELQKRYEKLVKK